VTTLGVSIMTIAFSSLTRWSGLCCDCWTEVADAGLPGDDTGLTAVFPHPPDAPNTRISAPRRSSVQKSATPMQSTLSSGAIRAAVSSVPHLRSAAHSAATQAPSLKLQQDIDDGDGAVSSTQSAVQSQRAATALVPSPGDSMFTDDDADAVTIDRVDATPSMLEEAELFPTTSEGQFLRDIVNTPRSLPCWCTTIFRVR
jgi:hypothetical protein